MLPIFQAMDAAGKDGAIKHVMLGVNPQGCQVFSFKHPSAAELEHDFLWRTIQCLPERGRIGIFYRSYYEEVLIVRVHPEILRSEGLPSELLDEKTVWEERYRSIVGLENHLTRNGTRIIKLFLHLSWDGKALSELAKTGFANEYNYSVFKPTQYGFVGMVGARAMISLPHQGTLKLAPGAYQAIFQGIDEKQWKTHVVVGA